VLGALFVGKRRHRLPDRIFQPAIHEFCKRLPFGRDREASLPVLLHLDQLLLDLWSRGSIEIFAPAFAILLTRSIAAYQRPSMRRKIEPSP
jgi:hypothetical protein